MGLVTPNPVKTVQTLLENFTDRVAGLLTNFALWCQPQFTWKLFSSHFWMNPIIKIHPNVLLPWYTDYYLL